jgi:S-adenosylmethionine/arginine decarboxylase-like enzyme
MDSEREQAVPDVDDLPHFIANRSRILTKTYQDHLTWEQALNVSTSRFGTYTSWVDSEGTTRTVVIDESYVAIHWKIMRSIILDLAECGKEGLDVLRAMITVSEGR